MKHITLRDLFWLILVAAILAAWWADRSQTQQELSRLKKEAEGMSAEGPAHDDKKERK